MRSLVAKRDAKGTWKSLIAVVSVVPKVTEKQKQISEQITAVTTKSNDAFEWRWVLYDSGFQAKTGVGSDDIKVVLNICHPCRPFVSNIPHSSHRIIVPNLSLNPTSKAYSR